MKNYEIITYMQKVEEKVYLNITCDKCKRIVQEGLRQPGMNPNSEIIINHLTFFSLHSSHHQKWGADYCESEENSHFCLDCLQKIFKEIKLESDKE